ncbi:MAG: right-handed parallel beta-helix repeat-containing protein, partial [Planctomycetota bacterium]
MDMADSIIRKRGILAGLALMALLAAPAATHGEIITVTYQVSGGADDGYAWSASQQDIASGHLAIGDDKTYTAPFYTSAMRFAGVTVPRSAAILDARLRIRSLNEDFRGQVYGLIQAESADNAADFASRYIAAAVRTTAAVDWDHKFAWDADTWQVSPDISGVVQELVDRGGWQPANSLVVFYDTSRDSGKSRNFGSFESGSPPVLEISFEAFRIAGLVTGADGNGVSDVVLSAGGSIESSVTDSSGYYELLVPGGWSGTVTPEKTDWGFSPPSRVYESVAADALDQDYVGIRPTISGHVRDVNGTGHDGVAVTAGRGGGSTSTDSDGYYELAVPYGWAGEVRCTKTDVYFDPDRRYYESMTAAIAGQDYTAVVAMQTCESPGGVDDGYVCGTGSQNLTSAYFYVGGECFGGIRFREVQIPKCATIHYAFLRLRVEYQQPSRSAPRYGVVQAEASDNPEDFSVVSMNSRPKTETGVNWDFPNGLDVFGWPRVHYSPNIASVIQAVVNRYDWKQGNSLVLFYSGRPEAGSITAGWHTRDVFPQFTPELGLVLDYPVTLSGYVRTGDGIGVEAVLVEADNFGGWAYTDPNGYYEIPVPLNWTGTVTPSRIPRSFTPAVRSYVDLTEDLVDQDFESDIPLVISGYVVDSNDDAFSGVFISTDNGATTDTTDANGYYSVEAGPGWSGTVTPEIVDWAFSPPDRVYSNVTVDHNGQDFAGWQPVISGHVYNNEGLPADGVIIAADNGGGSGVTDSNGYYELAVPYHWSGSIARSGGVAPPDPVSRSYSDVTADITGQDFSLVPVTVHPDGTGDYATIQAAINAAATGDVIYLADGTYMGGGNRDIEFKGKAISLISENGPETCIIDVENLKYHRGFYLRSGEDRRSIISGLTITGGNIYGDGGYGGGIYCRGASPTIENCIITGNRCDGYAGYMEGDPARGGGIACRDGANPLVIGCIISNNIARGGDGRNYDDWPFEGGNGMGGGVFCDGASGVVLLDCVISDNRSIGGNGSTGSFSGYGGHAYGGGLFCTSATLSVVDGCVFLNNRADGGSTGGGTNGGADGGHGMGGGIYGGTDSLVVANCSVVGNVVTGGWCSGYKCDGVGYGAGLYGTVEIIGCTIVSNSAEHRGGGTYGSPSIASSILWANAAPSGSQIYGGALVSYSDVQYGFGGQGNINANPLLDAPVDGVYHLSPDSPCINAGDPNYTPDTNELDIDGEARFNGGRVDMGCDEFCSATDFIVLSDVRFDFTAYIDGNQPASQNLLISNVGPNDLSWEITEDCSWLVVEPNSGICAAGGADEVVLSVDTSGVSGGAHSCNLSVMAPGASNSPLGIVVGLRNYGPVISLSSNDIDFLASQTNPYPADQSFEISNGGISVLDWQISVPGVCDWLTVEPTSGQAAGEVHTVTLHVDASGLSEGFHACDVTVSDYYAENNPQTVSVGVYVTEIEGRLIVPGVFENIQAAVDMAVDGDEVLIVPGRYVGEGNFDVVIGGKAITVRSIDPNDPNVVAATIVDGNNSGWYPGCNQCDYSETGFGFIFENGEGPNSVVEGLTIIGSGWGGGVVLWGGSPTIRNCIIRDNWGNGIYGRVSGDMAIAGCTISRNRGIEMGGGAIALTGTGSVTITDCLVSENEGWWSEGGGGIGYNWWDEQGEPITMSIRNCSITDNGSESGGGGILFEAGELLVEACQISGNSAIEGGGISLSQSAEANIIDCDIIGNRSSQGSGGGIYCHYAQLNISNCQITGNSSGCQDFREGGGGLYIYSAGPGQIIGCHISDNTTSSSGGGIYSANSEIIVRNCVLSNNSAERQGGAVAGVPRERYSMSLVNCIVSGNRAEDFGAVGPMHGPVSNCTIVGNYSYTDIVVGPPNGTISNNIFWDNRSISGQVIGGSPQLMYNCVGGGYEGLGNIDVDPCFAVPGLWDPNGTPDDANDDFWVDGDYHLKSAAGRWQPATYVELDPTGDGFINLTDFAELAFYWQQQGGFIPADLDRSGIVDINDLRLLLDNYLADYNDAAWVRDHVTSDAIDAGNPGCPLLDEPNDPNNLRINMGAFGGT